MNITLYEYVNFEKLKNVINCDNIPFETTDDKDWCDIFKKSLKFYVNKKFTDKGFEIEYKQPSKYGRYITKCGLQLFQRDVRKYISGEFVRDFDFLNCHPVILEQLFKKNGIYCEFLNKYNDNRSIVMKQCCLNSKLDLIKIIYNEIKPNKEIFNDLNDCIYNKLVPLLLKDKINKAVFDRIKRERNKKNKNYNFKGSFISQYIQNIENTLLMSFYNYLIQRNFKVHTLCFDGLTIDKQDDRINDDLIKDIELYILQETSFSIKIVEKSTETDWVPTINEDININDKITDCIEFSREMLDDLITDSFTEKGVLIKNNAYDVVKYLNNFLCYFESPFCFYFRDRTNDIFRYYKKDAIITRLGSNALNCFFMKYDCSLKYIKPVFVVNENDPVLKKNVYNSYKRPKFIPCASIEELTEKVPLFIDYLKRIISDNNNELYTYLLHYISKMVQVGKTNQCLVFKGKKGVGKSTFGSILKLIIENETNEYSQNINDILEIKNKFNSLDEHCIITTIEEVVTDAGSYHSVQNKLKDLIDSENLRLEKKGVDAIMVPSQNNILVFTNNLNPVEITDDNRRYVIIEVPTYEINNSNYFRNVKKQVVDNIELIRGFFNQFEFCSHLHNIHPTTNAELRLKELNKPSQKLFIEEEIDYYLDCEENNIKRLYSSIYENYIIWCNDNKYNQKLNNKYFSAYLNENGYYTKRVGKERKTMVYKNKYYI